jgi:hypothetical protein
MVWRMSTSIVAVEDIDMIAYGRSDPSLRLGVHLQLEV